MKEKGKSKRLRPIFWKSFFFFFGLSLIGSAAAFYLTLPDTIRTAQTEEELIYQHGPFSLTVERGEYSAVSDTTLTKQEGIETSEETGAYRCTEVTLRLYGIPIKTSNLQSWSEREVVVSGRTVGLDLSTDGVLVLGTGPVSTSQGEVDSPAKGLVYTGDCIEAVNGKTVDSVRAVQEVLSENGADDVTLTVRRDGKQVEVVISPIRSETGEEKIGLWIRDRAQGIGTLTYYDPTSGGYGAVGHGITDVDTGDLLPSTTGTLTGVRIRGLTKGQSGQAGEVAASLTSIVYGDIRANTEQGVFGAGAETIEGDRYPIAFRAQIENGEATLVTDLVTGSPEEYAVRIEKVMTGLGGRSAMIVEITDLRLCEVTGGIIQGMSGAPLLQNGALIGAVTHVFLKDPTRGYAIYIEDMMETMMEVIGSNLEESKK